MIATLRQAMDLIGRERRARWILLVVLAIVASVFEMVGAALVFVLLALVADPSGAIELPIVGDVQALADDTGRQSFLLGLVIAMGVFFVGRALVQVGSTYAQIRVAENAGAQLSNDLVRGYLRWPYQFHLRRNSSELIRNGDYAVHLLVDQVFVPVVRVVAEAVLVVGMLALLVALAPAAAAMAAVVVGGAAAVLLIIVQPRLKTLGRVTHTTARDALEALQQSLHGIRDIKLLGRERFFARRYATTRLRNARASYTYATLAELPGTIMQLALMLFILIYFGIAVATGNTGGGAISILGLFAYAGLRLQPSLHKIVSGLNNIKYSTAPLEDLHADLRTIREHSVSVTEVDPLPFDDSLVIDAVSFRYEGADRNALTDVDLVIEKGEEIGICGPTGGGKSTLADLVTGLLTPVEGSVRVDGVDIAAHSRAWQRNLGVVSQSVFLVDDTLRRNIALGVPDDEVDHDAVRAAIELAQATEFIDALPEGLDTGVGERGIRLSGGQRQRIAIARALYHRPSVLVFDEGTSALDNETESALMAAIEGLRGDRTLIHIAHRLSTVRGCDRVVFIADGHVNGIGAFDDLARVNPQFRRMAAMS